MTDTATDRLYDAFFEDAKLPYCFLEEARVFFADVARESEPAERALILEKFLPALNPGVPREVQSELIQSVALAAKEAALHSPFRNYDERLLETVFSDFCEAVNYREVGRKTVLFVATTPYFVILREAMYLRRMGFDPVLLCLAPVPGSLTAVVEETFVAVANTRGSFRCLKTLLEAVKPDLVHVQCWMWMYVLGRMAIETCPDSVVVCEFYDATSLFAERKDMLAKWKPALVDLDYALEHFIMCHADAVVSRYSPEVAQAWADSHGAAPRYLEFQPYPCPEFLHYAEARPSKDDGLVRLLHAGSFTPRDGDHPPSLYPEVSTPDVFLSLLEQGFAIDVLCPPHFDPDSLGPQYEAYRKLVRDFEHFQFMPGVSPDRFAEVASAYDFGILLFDYDPASVCLRDLWMKGVMPTRFFSYLEAGLPGIVISEYRDMTRFLEKNGVGFGVPSKDIPRLREIVADYDRDAAVANVRRYNEAHGMDKEIGRLVDLYNGLLTREGT